MQLSRSLALRAFAVLVFTVLSLPSGASANVYQQNNQIIVEITDSELMDQIVSDVFRGIANRQVRILTFQVNALDILDLGFSPERILFYNPASGPTLFTELVWMEVHWKSPSGRPYPKYSYYDVTHFDDWTIPIEALRPIYRNVPPKEEPLR